MARPLDQCSAIRRSISARERARRDERDRVDACVDGYYEATAFAHAALLAPCLDPDASERARCLYNASLADCLRVAGAFKRLDPRSKLVIHTPKGAIEVPVVAEDSAWGQDQFGKLVDARGVEMNSYQEISFKRPGLGAPEVVIRPNCQADVEDRFHRVRIYFPTTAILRPDIGPWLGQSSSTGVGDVLELHDPYRVGTVEFGGREVALASDLDAPAGLAEQDIDTVRDTYDGFLYPDSQTDKVSLSFFEPYQPGKVVIVLVHGLLDNPYAFTTMVNDLRSRDGFLDHFQLAAFRYPTGSTFLRSSAQLRQKLVEAEAALDPTHSDPGFQNMVLIGFSMGGLVTKLQICRSGDAIWDLGFRRPIDQLATSEPARQYLRETFYFEPVPFVRRVIFIATPHDGSGLASNILGKLASTLVQRPANAVTLLAQLRRDNPGVIKPYAEDLPSSIDLLETNSPLLKTLRRLPINPETRYHSIVGIGYLPLAIAPGDGVVPIPSAHIDGATSEHWLRATHNNIYRLPETIEEVDRILRVHLMELVPAS